MSFGPRKPTGPVRPTRPGVVKKPISKPVNRTEAPKPQPIVKAKKPTSIVSGGASKKVAPPVAPKVAVPKPPTPDPVYDYESDFESDESVPGGAEVTDSSESSGENSESNNSSSEGGDDEEEDETEGTQAVAVPNVELSVLEKVSPLKTIKPRSQQTIAKNARSVDILSKISLNEVSMNLYSFDPEEYAELRTDFGITSTVMYGKHTQTDRGTASIALQTSGIAVRSRSTCMHEMFGASPKQTEQRTDAFEWGDEDEDDSLPNYSSLQNIERMFTTLNGALERRFSRTSAMKQQLSAVGTIVSTHDRGSRNQQRTILQLMRKSAPIVEALLESRRFRTKNMLEKSDEEMDKDHTLDHIKDDREHPAEVVRSFDTGKMCPEFQIKLAHAKSTDPAGQNSQFVLEFWARGTYSRPMYRFGSWAPIVGVDYESRKHMMVFGGTSDGTLQMWLGDAGRSHCEILAPHQIVAPNVRLKHTLRCWEIVSVKVLPVPVLRDSTVDSGNESAFNQVFVLFASGIVVVWHVQVEKGTKHSKDDVLNVRLGTPEISLVQAKVIDLNSRIGGRLPNDLLRSFENLLLHDHHQMVLSSHRTVMRLSHFVQSQYDPVLLIQPDIAHSIMNLKRLAQTNDTLFVLYSNRTVRVLKLNSEPETEEMARNRLRKHDDQPHLMLNVCTNKSCTIQSIVHDEAKRYGDPNGAGDGRRADGGSIASKALELEKGEDNDALTRPRFHHGQQILFFDAQYPENILEKAKFVE